MGIETKNIEMKINEIYAEIVEIRRDIHRHPELGEEEIRTRETICRHLKDWGIEFYQMKTNQGVVGIVRGKKPQAAPAKTVGIRGDIDALPIMETAAVPFQSEHPGLMHACGHDLHTAILLGTAKILKDLEDQFTGNVKFFFQPAEETVGGALPMIQEGCLKDPEVWAVIGLHAAPELPVGSVQLKRGKQSAASNEFEVILKGRGCHGAHPDEGRDALLAGCYLVTALQSVASRNVCVDSPAVVTVGQFHAGTKSNIVAGEARLSGIIRTLDPETRSFAKKRVQEICELTARSLDMEAEVKFIDSYPALINDDQVESVLERVAAEVIPPELIYEMKSPSMGTDDFAYFCEACKGAYFNLGTRAPGDENAFPLHSSGFCPDEGCIRTGILMEVKGALALLED